eukprot:symbB.v1.2.024013.t1/scaffold2242.1/size84735/5
MGFLRLVSPSGHFLSNDLTVKEAGLKDGDTLNAIVQAVHLASTSAAFALWSNMGLVTWGIPHHGGDAGSIQDKIRTNELRLQQIQSTDRAFCAIFEDGTATAWGDASSGGDSRKVQKDLKEILHVQSSSNAFAAIRADGRVITWGSGDYGGNSREVQDQLKNVKCIQSSFDAFAALREDGSVVSWGDRSFNHLMAGVDLSGPMTKIQASAGAFAAIAADGHVVAWGAQDRGGLVAPDVSSQLTDVVALQATDDAFAAVRQDGTAPRRVQHRAFRGESFGMKSLVGLVP